MSNERRGLKVGGKVAFMGPSDPYVTRLVAKDGDVGVCERPNKRVPGSVVRKRHKLENLKPLKDVVLEKGIEYFLG